MSAFNPHEVTSYTASLEKQINTLIEHQNQLNDAKTNPKSNDLIKHLHILKKMLVENTKKQWFDKYILIYEQLFFEPIIRSYTNLILNEYLLLWLTQAVDEQIELAKVNEQTYRFPNVGVLSSDNFEDLIKKDLLVATRQGVLAYGLDATATSNYNATLGITVYNYNLTDKSENIFEVFVYPHKDLIKIETKGNGFNYCSFYLKVLLELICKQQERAK